MCTRVPASGTLAVLSLVLTIVVLAACVPEPANRATPAGGVGSTVTPEPTPAGPTPTPSFVRPTPTPQPTFSIYRVMRGDNLNKIAKQHGTDGRSIAYWNRLTYPSLDPDSPQYRPNYLVVGWMLQIIPNTVVDPEDLPPGPETAAPDFSDEPDEPEPEESEELVDPDASLPPIGQ